jgi:oligoribonuclease (3'-5' exoribonuclease)
MHTESGLLDKIPNGVSLSQAEELVMKFLQAHTVSGKSALF